MLRMAGRVADSLQMSNVALPMLDEAIIMTWAVLDDIAYVQNSIMSTEAFYPLMFTAF
jgi:hypothetical protein